MNICMITREFLSTSGGIGYYVYYLAKKLSQRGHKVYVITRSRSLKTTFELVDGINVYRVSFVRLYPLHMWLHGFYVNKLLKSLESNIQIVHLHSPLPPPINTPLPIITTVHSPCKRAFQKAYRDTVDIRSLAEQLQTMVLYTYIESRILKISDKITTVSHNVSEELKEYGLDSNKITVVGNAVDIDYFYPKPNNAKTNPYVLFVGILRSGKGLLDLLDLAKYVCDRKPDARFIVCGSGPLLKSLRLKALNNGLQNRITFLGYVNRKKILEFYHNAAVLVHPSAHEGLSTVILEAMSCGLPVVAYNIAGNRQVIKSGSNGILVDPGSTQAMAESILLLLNNNSLRNSIGIAARHTVEESYSWDRVTDRIIQCYDRLKE